MPVLSLGHLGYLGRCPRSGPCLPPWRDKCAEGSRGVIRIDTGEDLDQVTGVERSNDRGTVIVAGQIRPGWRFGRGDVGTEEEDAAGERDYQVIRMAYRRLNSGYPRKRPKSHAVLAQAQLHMTAVA